MVLIYNVTAAELNVCTHFIAMQEKLASVSCFEIEVVRVCVGSKPDFFQLDNVRFLSGFLLLLLLDVPVFAIIHDLANRWVGAR